MKTYSQPAIGVEALAPLKKQDFAELFERLDEHNVTHVFKQREPTAYNSLDWAIPTAIVVYLTHSYFDEIFKEMGKEHYHRLKGVFLSLYKKALGKKPEIGSCLFTIDGKVKSPSHFSNTLSLLYKSQEGHCVKLMFPLDITTDDYAISCEEFMKLLTAHIAGRSDDFLTQEIETQVKDAAALYHPFQNSHKASFLIYWDRHSHNFFVADPLASHSTGKLVSRALGSKQV